MGGPEFGRQYTDPPEESYGGVQDTSPGRAAEPLSGPYDEASKPDAHVELLPMPAEEDLIDGVHPRDIDWERYHALQRFKERGF